MTIRPYRYYLIDLDRTLWDFDSNSEHAIGLLISRNPVLYKAIQEKEGCGEDSLHRFFMRYDVLNHRLWAMYEKGEMTKEDLRWKRFHEAFRRYGIEDEALARQFGEDYLEQMVCENRLMPGAREMLEASTSSTTTTRGTRPSPTPPTNQPFSLLSYNSSSMRRSRSRRSFLVGRPVPRSRRI